MDQHGTNVMQDVTGDHSGLVYLDIGDTGLLMMISLQCAVKLK